MTKNYNIKRKRRDIWQNQQKAKRLKIVQQKQAQANQHLQKLVQAKCQAIVLIQKNAQNQRPASNKNHPTVTSLFWSPTGWLFYCFYFKILI